MVLKCFLDKGPYMCSRMLFRSVFPNVVVHVFIVDVFYMNLCMCVNMDLSRSLDRFKCMCYACFQAKF